MHPIRTLRHGINHYDLITQTTQSYSPECQPPWAGTYSPSTGMCTRPNGKKYCANGCPCPIGNDTNPTSCVGRKWGCENCPNP